MTWIFAYGSLVSPTSLQATIGRSIGVGSGMHVAELSGFRRAWNYGSAVLRGDWTAHDGTAVVGGLVVSLGIVEESGTSINGVVFSVDADELADLDWRERAYDRVDVTGRITLLDGSAHVELDEPIAVYVPQRVAVERYERHRDEGTAGVRRSYWNLVDEAFDELGPRHAEWYRATDPPDVPVVDITLDPLPARRPRAR
jgi:cation transport regulator ChaC